MIQIELKKTEFHLGETIDGEVRWLGLNEIDSLDIRLIWYTEGKGDRDFQVVASQEIRSPASEGQATFSFTAPNYPASCSGKLVSIRWAIEVVELPGINAQSTKLVISTNGKEVDLVNAANSGLLNK